MLQQQKTYQAKMSGPHYFEPKGPNAPKWYVVDAVSYTHLRAHETVLDLVCRLLLEKKNNTITQDKIITQPMKNTHTLKRE